MIIERALGGELTHHLGYPPGGAKPDDTTNHRHGTSGKTVLTDDGSLPIDVPRHLIRHSLDVVGWRDRKAWRWPCATLPPTRLIVCQEDGIWLMALSAIFH